MASACKASVGEIELDVGNYKNLFYGVRGGSYVSTSCSLSAGCLGSGVVRRVIDALTVVGKVALNPKPPKP